MSVATLPSDPLPAPAVGDAALQRSDGRAEVAFAGGRLAGLYQRSPCRVLLPRPSLAGLPEAVLVNTAGGIAGNDRLAHRVEVRSGAALVAGQAAEKVYRALDREARVDNVLTVGDGALLAWLPQETILFEGARLSRRMEVTLEGDGRLLAVETLVFGRAAHGETLRRLRLRDEWRVSRDGRLVWADALRLEDEAALGHPAGLAGGRALATLVYAGPDAADRLDAVRAMLPAEWGRAGATCIDGGLLLCRLLDAEPLRLRRRLAALAAALLAQLIPGARLPRVWHC